MRLLWIYDKLDTTKGVKVYKIDKYGYFFMDREIFIYCCHVKKYIKYKSGGKPLKHS